MGFIKNIVEKHKEQVHIRNEKCSAYIADVDKAMQSADSILAGSSDFVDPTQADIWMQSSQDVFAIEFSSDFKQIRRAKDYKTLIFRLNELKNRYPSLRQQIVSHNSQVARKKIGTAYELIGNVEGRKLDDQQMLCLVKDVNNHLVIAGAGTGKTTTVVGKIKYLLKSGKYTPKDILVLSFTNASATEMCERIQKETGEKIAASTFHKLGLAIIKKVNGITPKISQLNLRTFVKEQLTANMQNDSYLALLSSYLLFNRVVAKSEFEFSSQAEYSEYLKLNPPTTMNGETVKSYGEMDIANFLMQNGISYIYEHPYSVDTRTSEYGQYNPDFYLPDYDIYIEYFGINKNGEVPSYFSGRNGMTATQAYRASMEWKRSTHKENGTTMIECFAYEKFDGVLLDNLKANLERHSVELKPKTAKELWDQIASNESSILDGIIELFETLINLIKSNGYSIDDVRSLNTGSSNAHANNVILTLLEPIFNAYCQYLKEHDEIDFNDMIITATQYVRSGSFVNPFKYVIVDEYQDISKARFLLLQALRESSDYDLFCVGDDWQSIYRFAGSDIGYILNFEKYWGSTETSKIETTYRFTQQLIEISGSFIMKNPMQIKKAIKGKPSEHGFVLGNITGYTEKYAIDFTVKRLDDLPKGSSVFFIGRYSFDSKMLDENCSLTCRYNNVTGFVDVVYARRPDLKMSFVTAHKSKGLQADYVFIINNKKSRMGFPSKIQDAAILNLLLDNSDSYPDSEERRLFYVAMTRAKIKAYLVTIDGQESSFAEELIARYGEEMKREQFVCPLCGGRLLRRSGPYGEFFGCSNYSKTGCNYKRNIVSKGVNQKL